MNNFRSFLVLLSFFFYLFTQVWKWFWAAMPVPVVWAGPLPGQDRSTAPREVQKTSARWRAWCALFIKKRGRSSARPLQCFDNISLVSSTILYCVYKVSGFIFSIFFSSYNVNSSGRVGVCNFQPLSKLSSSTVLAPEIGRTRNYLVRWIQNRVRPFLFLKCSLKAIFAIKWSNMSLLIAPGKSWCVPVKVIF